MSRPMIFAMMLGGCGLIGQMVAGPQGMAVGVGIAMVLAAIVAWVERGYDDD